MAGMMGRDRTEALAAMTRPPLIIWGDRDALFGPGHEYALHGAIPHAGFLAYEGVGHGVQWEVPQRATRDVGRFALGLDRWTDSAPRS